MRGNALKGRFDSIQPFLHKTSGASQVHADKTIAAFAKTRARIKGHFGLGEKKGIYSTLVQAECTAIQPQHERGFGLVGFDFGGVLCKEIHGQSDVGGKVAQQLVRVIRAIIIGGGDTGHAQRATAKFAFVALGRETLS